MLDKRQLSRIVPYVLAVLVGYIVGIAGWSYNYAEDSWRAFCICISVIITGSILQFLVWKFSPIAKRNEVNTTLPVLLITLTWLFMGVTFSFIITTVLYDSYPSWFSIPYACVLTFLQFTMFIQFILLSTCKMPTLVHRILIAWPASIQFSSILVSLLLIIMFPIMTWVPYASTILIIPMFCSIIGLYQTTYTPKDITMWDHVLLEYPNNSSKSEAVERCDNELIRTKFSLSKEKSKDSIRIVQITDPHLGTMMSESRLQTICEQAVQSNPDIILLTGDFYTVEAYERSQHVLANAIAPLKELGMQGKVFACDGNHDQEQCAYSRAEEDLATIGVSFLEGEESIIELPQGKVQVIGLDYFRPKSGKREKHIENTMEKNCLPNDDIKLRIAMLHDPSAFYLIPQQNNIVFSGHTHGGQLGLVSFGINFSIIQIAGLPDQGFFKKGNNRLYLHRAQGCRCIMGTLLVRMFCPPEFSVLDIKLK